MYDWISLDGKRSDTMTGLIVMTYTPLYLPARSREETVLPGRLTAITQSAWQQEPADIPITLAVVGAGQAQVDQAIREDVLPWLYNATRLTLDNDPDHHYRGAVTKVELQADENRWVELQVTFRCNPPCRLQLLSNQDGWYPAADVPIPQQITAENATVSGSFTAAGWLDEIAYPGLDTAESYLMVTGSWQTLKLGDTFEVLQAAEDATLYMDAENDQVWMCEEDGTEINWMGATSGEMPEIGPGKRQLYVGGENINVTVRMLVIARG